MVEVLTRFLGPSEVLNHLNSTGLTVYSGRKSTPTRSISNLKIYLPQSVMMQLKEVQIVRAVFPVIINVT